jgi:hypothetical protein
MKRGCAKQFLAFCVIAIAPLGATATVKAAATVFENGEAGFVVSHIAFAACHQGDPGVRCVGKDDRRYPKDFV